MTNAAKIFIPPGFLACHSGGRDPYDFIGDLDLQHLPSIRRESIPPDSLKIIWLWLIGVC